MTTTESDTQEATRRLRLGSPAPPDSSLPITKEIEEDVGQCSICLQGLIDRTVLPLCAHEFCFECILLWSSENSTAMIIYISHRKRSTVFFFKCIDQSRSCPLCTQNVGEYLIHRLRGKYDYVKHYLIPLSKSPKSASLSSRVDRSSPLSRRSRGRTTREFGRRSRERESESDRLERAIEKRKWVYRNNLYVKVRLTLL